MRFCYTNDTMKKLWTDKLSKTGKLIIHSKNCKWIKVQEYWNKWIVETCWHEQWLFYTAEEALEKANDLIKGGKIEKKL